MENSRRPTIPSGKYGPPDETASALAATRERVYKRDGSFEEVSIAKIEQRLEKLSHGLNVNIVMLSQQIISGVYDGIHTAEIDRLSAGFAHEKITDHPDYDVLAARIIVSNHHKETIAPFSEVMLALHVAGQISDAFIEVVMANSERIDGAIDYDRDYLFTYFGFKTFETGYGLRIRNENGKEVVYERPQHMFMRASLAMYLDDLDAAFECYEWMSCQYFTPASPSLFNLGTRRQQCSSCFLVAMKEEPADKESHPDSIDKIYSTLKGVAKISKSSGGIGMHISTVRAEGSPITSAGRSSAGIIPMLKPFEATANYVDQGRKRKGAIAVYLETFHADIEDFLEVKNNTGAEAKRMRDLHIALWISDIFMKRVDEDGNWSLMCPFYSPDLVNLYGVAFDKRYVEYEAMGFPYVRRTVRARDLWTKIIDAQIHNGEPYMLYKDAINRKTNHQNLGTIRSSNLCVAPYTRILTKELGSVAISTLKDQPITVWNGFEWSETVVRQTGFNKHLLQVAMSNGSVIDCTPEHNFYIGSAKVQAQNLKRDDCLDSWSLPDNSVVDKVKIVSVTPMGGVFDTYCFTESKRGTGMFEGVITGQCAEIALFSDSDHTAVCNLSSISLKSFVVVEKNGTRRFDHETLRYVTKLVTRNLDRIIDINDYPTKEAKRSNLRERPLGIGVQGLADAYIAMRFPFDSAEASKLNREIFETMYYASLEASCDLAVEAGEPYPSYHMNGGCPVSKGVLQFDMWRAEGHTVELSGRWNWDELRARIITHGVRNSMLVALMPTASTSQLLGNTEAFEAFTNNIYVRTTLSGSYKVVNQQMILDLIDAGLWNDEMKNKIIYLGGSIQDIPEIPKKLRDLYKTAFDLSQRVIIDQSADRAPFVDQTQSLNIHIAAPTLASVTSMHMYGWKRGLKTGMYYLRSQPAKRAVQVTVDPTLAAAIERQLTGDIAGTVNTADEPEPEQEPEQEVEVGGFVCRREEGCTSCSG